MPEDVRRTGLLITPEEKKRNREARRYEDYIFTAPVAPLLPEHLPERSEYWNWMNVEGKNFVSEVEDQGHTCNSCTAFATTSVIESNWMIWHNGSRFDLSEADLFLNGGGDCASGMRFEDAINYASAKGVCDEASFRWGDKGPRPDTDARCFDNWKTIHSPTYARLWIRNRGPVMTGMIAYEDLYHEYRCRTPLERLSSEWGSSIRQDIYSRAEQRRDNIPNKSMGDHAVCIVGYAHYLNCWIVKNSWGRDWGYKGFFLIPYDECEIGVTSPFYGLKDPAKDRS